jgi:hypothetical protein
MTLYSLMMVVVMKETTFIRVSCVCIVFINGGYRINSFSLIANNTSSCVVVIFVVLSLENASQLLMDPLVFLFRCFMELGD